MGTPVCNEVETSTTTTTTRTSIKSLYNDPFKWSLVKIVTLFAVAVFFAPEMAIASSETNTHTDLPISQSETSNLKPSIVHCMIMPGRIAEVNPLLATIDDVVIDENGRFKYILCKVYQDGNKDQAKMIVRGTKQAEFHADIYDHLDAFLEEIGVTCECVGGGKIDHDSVAKTINVFGHSQGYGKADHSVTVRLLKEKYPDYNSITWMDD